MDRAGLIRVVVVVALVVLVALYVVRDRRSEELVDERLLPAPDGSPHLLPTPDGSLHLLPTPDGREHGLDDPAPRGSGGRRLPDRVCSS